MNYGKLREPFPAKDIEWRVQDAKEKKGARPWARVLAYVTNRAIQDRLDDVCTPAGWRNEFTTGPGGGILCGISIKCGEEWVTKWDGAENTNIEAVKGGLSGAMKRAGSQWGIGRYLYNLDAGWGNINQSGAFSGKFGDSNNWFKWDAPMLPDWALPGGSGKPGANPTKKKSAPKESKPQSKITVSAKDAAVKACKGFAAADVDAYIEAHAGGKAKTVGDFTTDDEWEWLLRTVNSGELNKWVQDQVPC